LECEGKLSHLSKNQRKILEILEIKPEMTTKEIAEVVFGKLVDYKTKEYNSIHRSVVSLEKKGLVQRVHVQLRWRRKVSSGEKPSEAVSQT
jgi:DNA-binding MarR family transcriptional regulator